MPDPTPELEAVARAIAIANDCTQEDYWHAWLPEARAALAAVLLEPSEELLLVILDGMNKSVMPGESIDCADLWGGINAAGRHILGERE